MAKGRLPLEHWRDKKPVTVSVVKHFYEPIAFANNGKLCIPSCCPSTKSCNGGGRLRLRQLRREARIWSCYEDSDFDLNLWEQNYQNSINSDEVIKWTFLQTGINDRERDYTSLADV